MSPASSGAPLEVEKYIGACLISQRSKHHNHHHQHNNSNNHHQRDIFSGTNTSVPSFNGGGGYRVQRWAAGGMPLISFTNRRLRRGGGGDHNNHLHQHNQNQQNNGVSNGVCGGTDEGLSRLAVHTQGAPLILTKNYHNNNSRRKQHNQQGRNNSTTTNSSATTKTFDKSRSVVTGTSGATTTNNNSVDTVSVTSDESSSTTSSSSSSSSSSSTNSDNCLPRIIKPRKRRKKDRKPSLVATTTTTTLSATLSPSQRLYNNNYYGNHQDGFSTDSASPDIIDSISNSNITNTTLPFLTIPFLFETNHHHRLLVPDNSNLLQQLPIQQVPQLLFDNYTKRNQENKNNNVIVNKKSLMEMSETPQLHHTFEDVVEMNDNIDINGNQSMVCQCRYCDPSGQNIWDVDRNCYSPFLTAPTSINANNAHHTALAAFTFSNNNNVSDDEGGISGESLLKHNHYEQTNSNCLVNRMSSVSLEDSIGINHNKMQNNNNGGGCGDLEVSTEIVTSLNGHRDIEIKFFSSTTTNNHNSNLSEILNNKCAKQRCDNNSDDNALIDAAAEE